MAIIDKSSDYFNPVIYNGTGNTLSITSLDFAPNWVWIKRRNGNAGHKLQDSVRGAAKQLTSNNTNAEQSNSDIVTSLNSNGFTLSTNTDVNGSGGTYVAWNWKAGTSFTNDASATGIGSIDSTGSVNTDAGFSIISWTSPNSNANTIAHGLGAVPKMIIMKKRGGTGGWITYHQAMGNTHGMFLSTTSAQEDNAAFFNDTSPTSTVFTTGTDAALINNTMIAYCFADVQGFSKMGSYVGNGNADGPFVYTGFKPAFVMTKKMTGSSQWVMFDNKRSPINYVQRRLQANNSAAENTDDNQDFDILSNGFKSRRAAGDWNSDGDTFIYMAFAENPFVTSTGNGSIPSPAR